MRAEGQRRPKPTTTVPQPSASTWESKGRPLSEDSLTSGPGARALRWRLTHPAVEELSPLLIAAVLLVAVAVAG